MRAIPGPVLVGAGIFAAPAALSLVGAGGPGRLLFVAAAAAQGFVLARSRPGAYVGWCVTLFLFSPLLRRVIDLHAGFPRLNITLLASYAAVLAGAPSALRYLAERRAHAGPFLILIATIFYGLGMAMWQGNTAAGAYEALRWLTPPLLGLYILAHAGESVEIEDAVTRVLAISLPLIGLYGLYQYVRPPPWDEFFLLNAPISSFGRPEPFEVRVFSTLNSPGSLGTALGFGLVLVIMRGGSWAWLTTVPALAALVLTLQRSSQAAFLLAMLIVAFTAGRRVLRPFAVLGIGVVVGLVLLQAVPQARDALARRLSTTVELSQDRSAGLRLDQYRVAPDLLEAMPLGRGLGWASGYAYLSGNQHFALDSGIIDALLGLGFGLGLVFFATIGTLAWKAARQAYYQDAGNVALCAGLVFSLVQLPMGSQYVGEMGIYLWLSIALLLAKPAVPAAAPAEAINFSLTARPFHGDQRWA